MRLLLISILGIVFVSNAYVLTKLYPDQSTNFDVWYLMDTKRHLVYEFMFAAFFWLTYSLSDKGTLLKAVACGFAILASGSVIDKCFGITTYLKSDVLLVIGSIIISAYVFFRERKHGN